MQRRDFLSILAALPFVGWMVPKAKAESHPYRLGFKIDDEAWVNLTDVYDGAHITTYAFDNGTKKFEVISRRELHGNWI